MIEDSEKNNIIDYNGSKFKKLENLIPFVLVTGGGRSGTDFLQSLLDSHEQVLSYNGHLKLYIDFFTNSKCIKSGSFNLIDIAHEFIGLYIERFNSKYDYLERKDQLGENESESLKIDTQLFIKNFILLLKNQKKSYKNILLGIHGAYHICLQKDLDTLKILFYHAHHFDEAYEFIKDFPSATIVCTTRDPRAGFVSTIENWKKYDNINQSLINFDHDNYLFFYFHLNRIIEDEGRLVYSNKKHIIVKLEDLLNIDYMKNLSNLLFIDYSESMLSSTFGGKLWHGDRISQSKIYKIDWSEDRTYNGWKKKLNWLEKSLINYAMYSKLKRNKYEHKPLKIFSVLTLLLLSIIPFKYEKRYISFKYIKSLYNFNKLRAIYFLLITPFIFMKVRILLFKYIIIQFLNNKNLKNSYFLP